MRVVDKIRDVANVDSIVTRTNSKMELNQMVVLAIRKVVKVTKKMVVNVSANEKIIEIYASRCRTLQKMLESKN